MGLFDIFKRKVDTHNPSDDREPPEKKMSTAEKERIMVERVTSEDMMQFSMIPYQLNCPIHKSIVSGGHPFAYMNLNNTNQTMAKEELERINKYIIQAQGYIDCLPSSPPS